MTKHLSAAVALSVVTAAVHLQSSAADDSRMDIGKQEFAGKCATCHGLDGKGRGPLATYLRVAPADLTVLGSATAASFPTCTLKP